MLLGHKTTNCCWNVRVKTTQTGAVEKLAAMLPTPVCGGVAAADRDGGDLDPRGLLIGRSNRIQMVRLRCGLPRDPTDTHAQSVHLQLATTRPGGDDTGVTASSLRYNSGTVSEHYIEWCVNTVLNGV